MAVKKAVKSLTKKATKPVKERDWLDDQADEINDAFAKELSELTEADINRLMTKKTKDKWPKVTIGSHSTRTEYEDGRVDFVTDWDKLAKDVREAIAEYEHKKMVDEAPFHPGYEGAVVTPSYEPDDGPITKKQIKQIKDTAPKPKKAKKK